MEEPRPRITNPKGIRAKIHDQRMQKIREREPKKERGYRRGAAEVVPGFQLSAILREWVVEWFAERPKNIMAGSFTNEERNESHYPMGPINWLSEKADVNVRRVQGIVNGEWDFVSLEQADKLLTALEMGYKLHTGEIQVVPNPRWTTEQWIEWQSERGCE